MSFSGLEMVLVLETPETCQDTQDINSLAAMMKVSIYNTVGLVDEYFAYCAI